MWGGSGSQSLREALKCESQGKGATSPGELDYPQINGNRLDYCLSILIVLHYFFSIIVDFSGECFSLCKLSGCNGI